MKTESAGSMGPGGVADPKIKREIVEKPSFDGSLPGERREGDRREDRDAQVDGRDAGDDKREQPRKKDSYVNAKKPIKPASKQPNRYPYPKMANNRGNVTMSGAPSYSMSSGHYSAPPPQPPLPPHYGYPNSGSNPYGPPPPYGYHGLGGPPPPPPLPPHHMPMYGGGPPYPGPPPPNSGHPGGTHHHHGGSNNYHHRPPPPPYSSMPPYSSLPYPPPPPPQYHGGSSSMMASSSDSASVSSKSSKHSKKKRTIDGVHDGPVGNLPSAYAFRRTDSTSSTTSTVTAGNNTSADTYMSTDSVQRPDCSDALPPLSMEKMSFDDHHNVVPHRLPQAHHQHRHHHHRREYSADASTASSLSGGGFSLASYEPPAAALAGTNDDQMLPEASIQKRRKGNGMVIDTNMRPPSAQSFDGAHSSRFEQLSIDTKPPVSTTSDASKEHQNLFLTLSTSPINAEMDTDATPLKKNTSKDSDERVPVAAKPKSTEVAAKTATTKASIFKVKGRTATAADVKRNASSDSARPVDTPTPPIHGELSESTSMLTDEHSMLNRHLRGQSFTPLPHLSASGTGDQGDSPSHAYTAGIAPQLSWSIAGDTPSLGDLAEWEEDATGNNKAVNNIKTEAPNKPTTRPTSTTSNDTRNMMISPHDFQMWKEEHELAESNADGTSTPLPVFFGQNQSEGSENVQVKHERPKKTTTDAPRDASEHHHHAYPHNPNSSLKSSNRPMPTSAWGKEQHSMSDNKMPLGMPPTPMYAGSCPEYMDYNVPSPHHADYHRRDMGMDFYQMHHYHQSHHQAAHNDRIRNLRGRMPGHHFPPMPLNIPPPMPGHHHLPMTSPMGLGPGKSGLWSPHHGMGPHLGSPHHHMTSPLSNMAQSKRKCVPLKPPIPSKFQGDMEKAKAASIPEFTSLVNFPAHISQKQSVNLPEGMRCCVMCGSACPCTTGGKCSKKPSKSPGMPGSSKNGSTVDMLMNSEKAGYAIIPTQNKGLCTMCDVNVWVVVSSGLEIKWCKGCKNFRPWAAFGDKGLATKCLRCRERQREKYALQKEEKEKARLVKTTSSSSGTGAATPSSSSK